jgi:antirestriction protein ArdC
MNNDAFVKNVASRLIEQIRNGTAPWQKPWRPGTSFLPFNPTNGTRYKGINVVNLLSRGYGDARWMTYRQAQTKGYQVRKGEKGTQVQYWRFDEERKIKDSNGRPVIDANGEPRTEKVRLERPQVFIAYVFNRLTEFRRRRLVSVPGTRLKRLNSLFKQQILNFSTLPVIMRITDHRRIPSICL